MAKCTFCGKDIEQGTGTLYIKDDAKMFNFCTLKCKKNHLNLKRNPVHTRWTLRFKK
ncbi:50S ribosomal protein L24e [Candidatus Woesearchaeota archaeon]|jgi:large subunit ribosomal protein L24e|nr:50S ribosomal protein L24e [Candidatus Woesearchaeota archaeon]MBT6045067.1 50S ribosomal protein L24e [Candidatus Woesearchaeota archaeon]